MILVREIMIPIDEYTSINEKATIKEAIAALRASFHRKGNSLHGHQSLLVLNEKGELVGLLTLRSLLNAIGIRALVEDIWIKAESWSWYYLNRLREQSSIRVQDIMRPIEMAVVKADDNVLKAAHLLFTHQVNLLPVLEKTKVVGILRTLDVFRIIKDMI